MQTKDNAQFHIVLVKGWVEKGGGFLMARRASTELHMPGAWSLPGGKMENDGGPGVIQKQLKAEIMEEVGVEISNDIQLIYNNAFVRADGAHVVGLTFLCHHKSGEARALEDTAEVRWFTLGELKDFKESEDFLKREIEALTTYLNKK